MKIIPFFGFLSLCLFSGCATNPFHSVAGSVTITPDSSVTGTVTVVFKMKKGTIVSAYQKLPGGEVRVLK